MNRRTNRTSKELENPIIVQSTQVRDSRVVVGQNNQEVIVNQPSSIEPPSKRNPSFEEQKAFLEDKRLVPNHERRVLVTSGRNVESGVYQGEKSFRNTGRNEGKGRVLASEKRDLFATDGAESMENEDDHFAYDKDGKGIYRKTRKNDKESEAFSRHEPIFTENETDGETHLTYDEKGRGIIVKTKRDKNNKPNNEFIKNLESGKSIVTGQNSVNELREHGLSSRTNNAPLPKNPISSRIDQMRRAKSLSLDKSSFDDEEEHLGYDSQGRGIVLKTRRDENNRHVVVSSNEPVAQAEPLLNTRRKQERINGMIFISPLPQQKKLMFWGHLAIKV